MQTTLLRNALSSRTENPNSLPPIYLLSSAFSLLPPFLTTVNEKPVIYNSLTFIYSKFHVPVIRNVKFEFQIMEENSPFFFFGCNKNF